MTLEKAIDRAIDRCNLIGENCDVWAIMYQYKAIRELTSEQQDEVYDYITRILGFETRGGDTWYSH